jgi:surfeit locus 1 family protein
VKLTVVDDKTNVPAQNAAKMGPATFAVLAIVLVILLGLGTWQVQRLGEKEALLADIASRQAMPPVPLSDILALQAGGTDVEYRRVTVDGVFDHTKERHFLATQDGQPGYHVYTPLILADGQVLFVNRGFVPLQMEKPETRAAGNPQGQVHMVGLARKKLGSKPSSMVPDNDIARNMFFWKDLDAMAQSTGFPDSGVLQIFVDADATPNPGGYPQGGVTIIDLPNNHLQYAVTWYGLAAALVIIAGILWWRGRQKSA